MLKLFCVPFDMQHNETPLIAGTKHRHLAVVKYLLESTEANVDATDKVSFNKYCRYSTCINIYRRLGKFHC